MCSCAFYPLHLVYSGLIWIFGVRVNYISKLFLHFYIYILASHRVLSWFMKTLPRNRVSLCTRHLKLNRMETCIHRFSITLPITKHQFHQLLTDRSSNTHRYTLTHILTHSFCSCARIFCDSHQSLVCYQERNVRVVWRADVRRSFIELYNMWTFLFFLSLSLSLFRHIYARCDCVTEQIHGFSEKASYLLPYIPIIPFQKYIELCIRHYRRFLQLDFYLSMLFH